MHQFKYDRTFEFDVSILGQLAQRAFWHNEKEPTLVGTSISTSVCYQIPSFQTNFFGSVQANSFNTPLCTVITVLFYFYITI